MANRKVVPTEAGDRTKQKILFAAEQLFARCGFDGVSLREIGRAADVPFALITYHFRTKQELYRAVFKLREPFITTMRLDRLGLIEITGVPRADIHSIAEAIVEPLVDMQTLPGGLDFTRLIARETTDPMESARGVVAEFLDPVALAAVALLEKAAPGASHKEVCWAFYLASGALAVTSTNPDRLERLSSGKLKMSSTKETKANLTGFLANGWIGMLLP